MSYLRRSHTNSRLFFFGAVLLVIFLIILGCNIVLHFQKDRLTAEAAKYFTQKVTVENLLYLPPNFVFLKNISLSENSGSTSKKIMSLPLVMVKFSMAGLLKSAKITVTDICVYGVHTEYADFRDFVKNNFKQIWQFFLELPRQDIKFLVKDAWVDLAKENGGPGYIDSRFYLKIKDDNFYGYGSSCRNLTNNFRGIPLDYVFNGSLDKDGVSVDNLEIMRENIYAKLWGSVHNLVLRFNGFTFLNTNFKERDYSQPVLSAQEGFADFLRGFPAPPKTLEMPKVDLFILDLESQIDFHLPEIDIQRLKFSLNNNPMSLSGKINFSWDKPILLDFLYSTSFSQLKNWTGESPSLKKINIKLKGSLWDKVFKGDSDLSFDFLKKRSGNLPLEEFTAKLKELILSFQQYPTITASARNAEIFCRTDSSDYKTMLQYLGLIVNLENPILKSAEFESRFYDGKLRGRVLFDMSRIPPKITSLLRIKNATANKLEDIMVHFSKVHGKISGQMRFCNFPDLDLKGGLIVNNGYIEDFEFLKWLSGFFNLPKLKKIEFPRATINFSADTQGVGLSNIKLVSKDVALGGDFHLGANNMVVSKLALTCSRNLLERSVKFKPLMRLVGKDVGSLTFEFRLSGNLHNMNFLWLESDFKRRLRESIPGFMERSVERKIEESLESLSP